MKIKADLLKPENKEKLDNVIKYGEYKSKEAFFALFDDNNHDVTIDVGDFLKLGKDANGQDKLLGKGGETKTESGGKSTITLDYNIVDAVSDGSLSPKGQLAADKLVESTALHELTHHGDNQDRENADQVPLVFSRDPKTGLVTTNKDFGDHPDAGTYMEEQSYGKNIDANDNPELKKKLINDEKNKPFVPASTK